MVHPTIKKKRNQTRRKENHQISFMFAWLMVFLLCWFLVWVMSHLINQKKGPWAVVKIFDQRWSIWPIFFFFCFSVTNLKFFFFFDQKKILSINIGSKTKQKTTGRPPLKIIFNFEMVVFSPYFNSNGLTFMMIIMIIIIQQDFFISQTNITSPLVGFFLDWSTKKINNPQVHTYKQTNIYHDLMDKELLLLLL